MKKNFYSALVLMLAASQIFAQCGARYKDMIFSNVTTHSNVTYSTSNGTTLKMDIFEPTGDTASMRPVMVMAHGGSFTGGTKSTDNVCTTICTNFAKRGYVTASIDYRLGNPIAMLDSSNAITVVMKAISDGKSAIRFFRKDAATTNTYRIDSNHIFAGGNSAGAVLYMHCIYIDSLNECPVPLRTIITNNGGIEGNSGNAGYSSQIQALMNLAGGLNVPEFVGPGSRPSFNAQGDQDATVPYNCANAQSGLTPVRLCGLGVIKPLYDQFGVNYAAIVYPGEGHVPWQSNAAEMTQIDTTSANFFYSLLCSTVSSIKDVRETAEVSLFPNPVSDALNIHSSARVSNVMLFDNLGRLASQNTFDSNNVQVNTSSLPKGLYQVRLSFADKNISSVVRKIMVE
jgi:para-nitrobenzyl esterase